MITIKVWKQNLAAKGSQTYSCAEALLHLSFNRFSSFVPSKPFQLSRLQKHFLGGSAEHHSDYNMCFVLHYNSNVTIPVAYHPMLLMALIIIDPVWFVLPWNSNWKTMLSSPPPLLEKSIAVQILQNCCTLKYDIKKQDSRSYQNLIEISKRYQNEKFCSTQDLKVTEVYWVRREKEC